MLICPVPIEFNACRETLRMRDLAAVAACRSARSSFGEVELTAVESGPAKARAAAATMAACHQCRPDIVVDTGSCAGIAPGSAIGQVVFATVSYEYDIGGGGIPTKSLPAMKLPAAMEHLEAPVREGLLRGAADTGGTAGVTVRIGAQACGELLVQSPSFRRTLYALFQALAANWESSGVFVAAFRSAIPALSVRVITDLGDEQALGDFRRHIRGRARELFGYIQSLAEAGWFGRFKEAWTGLDPAQRAGLPRSVWP